MKIYTKTGDNGSTSLFSGERVLKSDPFIEAVGTIDECNSAIGMAVSFLPRMPFFELMREELETIQHALFDVGAAVATPRTRSSDSKIKKTRFDNEEIKRLEIAIDAMETELPPLKTFILPGGHPAGAMLHLARSICRRAERAIIPLMQLHDVCPEIIMYINRLSDFLFVASRFINHKIGCPETLWEQHKRENV